ncbi:MAG: hypothetical protein HY897_12605 [Deltaproteobacteria bacterium]|nr:hypothetical protein [Deltaproteobacteria bacterium]
MMRPISVVFAVLFVPACSSPAESPTDTGFADAGAIPDSGAPLDTGADGFVDAGADAAWDGGLDAGPPGTVNGWILLDADPAAVSGAIEAAAGYGVNHIELSHDIIMDIDELLGDTPEAAARVKLIGDGIALAHQKGMKAYIWTHEFNNAGIDICYAPKDPVWELRGQAYRDGIARIPDLDGVVLMFGSAQVPPWFTLCTCAWCERNKPTNADKIRIVTEQIGGVIANELGKELFIRTFVHEPAEIAWHHDGLEAAAGVEFIGHSKADVQDWQPYNPPDPNLGGIEGHYSVMEMDAAGEYWGVSVLPFCAPGYFWFRLNHMFDTGGVGAAVRVARGSDTALGTPNEINVLAVRDLLAEREKPLDEIWAAFIESKWGLPSGTPAHTTLRRILEDTFAIRLKSHYVLGIWALEKGSDIPTDTELGEFYERGKMPKWDPDWQAIWDSLDRPDKAVALRVWQEGNEAVVLSETGFAEFATLEGTLDGVSYDDLHRRLAHQRHAARVWRDVKLFIWAARARGWHPDDPDLPGLIKWAHDDLVAAADAIDADGMSDVELASPARVRTFVANTARLVPEGAVATAPNLPIISPVATVSTTTTGAELRFSVDTAAHVWADYGLEMPDFGKTVDIGDVAPGAETAFSISDLTPGKRYVIRIRAEVEGTQYAGGDWWVFTPFK